MSARLSAGALRHRIVLQRRDAIPDEAGGARTVFTPFATAWAQIVPAAPRRRPDAAALLTGGEYRLRLRYRTDVRPGMRVLWGPQTLDVLQVAPLSGERRFLDLLCREVGDDD